MSDDPKYDVFLSQPGELVEDCLVVSQIFKIADGADVRVETDKILDDLHKIAATFVDFGTS